MISIFLLLLFHAIGGLSAEPTRVYNAKARSPDGSNDLSDMQIQVIQVGLVNFDEEGRRITQPPIPVTVHNEIRHRVTWSPETGVQKIESSQEDESKYHQQNFKRPENTLFPNFISQYFARTNMARSPTEDSELFIFTVLGLCIGLSIFILFVYFINLCLQRRKKKHEMIITRKIIYRPRFDAPLPPPRPPLSAARPILYEPEYENLSDLDEAETYIPLPPPLPPRKKRPRPPLHLVLDQPVTWLLEKPSSTSGFSESSGHGSLVKQRTRQEEEAAKYAQRQNYERRKARRIRRGSF